MKYFAVALLLVSGAIFFFQRPSEAGTSIAGSVRDQLGRPIENARVRIMGGNEFVTSGPDGRFSLPLQSSSLLFFQFPVTAGKEGWINGRCPSPGHGMHHFPAPRSQGRFCRLPHDDHLTGRSPAGTQGRHGNDGEKGLRQLSHHPPLGMGSLEDGADAPGYPKVLEHPTINSVANGDPTRPTVAPTATPPSPHFVPPGHTDYGYCRGRESQPVQRHRVRFLPQDRSGGGRQQTGSAGHHHESLQYRQRHDGPGFRLWSLRRCGDHADGRLLQSPALPKSEFCSSCHQDAIPLPAGDTWDFRKVYPDSAVIPCTRRAR